jgi:hypothetical protein
MDKDNGTAIAVTEEIAAPLRPMSPAAVVDALTDYRELQSALDVAFPDCIMHIQGRQFRKKSYWRAVATAFRLSVEITDDREYIDDNGGRHYLATARATAPDGRTATGDGSCSATEKHGNMATLHNIRAHACTRAKNRAISDLVGFGEVSADELGAGDYRDAERNTGQPRTIPAHSKPTADTGAHAGLSHTTHMRLTCPDCGGKAYDHVKDKAAGTTTKPALGCGSMDCDFVIWSATEAMAFLRSYGHRMGVSTPPPTPPPTEADPHFDDAL